MNAQLIKVNTIGVKGYGLKNVVKVRLVDSLNTLDVISGRRYIIKTDYSEIEIGE